MERRHTLALRVLATSAVLAALGDVLFHQAAPGVNIVVWVAALLGGACWLTRPLRAELKPGTLWLVAPLLVFAAGFSLFDSPGAFLVSLLGLALTTVLVSTLVRHVDVREMTLLHGTLGVVVGWLWYVADAILLLAEDVQWKLLGRSGSVARAAPYLRGVLIAVPLLLLFGALLTHADAVFSKLATDAFRFDGEAVFGHAWVVALCGIIAATVLRQALLGRPVDSLPQSAHQPQEPLAGSKEALVVVGLLDLLLLSFVAVQFRTFVGGAAIVRSTTGLSWGEYVHQGFFELVTVSLLALPVVVGFWSLARRGGPVFTNAYRGLALVLIGLLGVVMDSAVNRMVGYVSDFGLSELRVYATALMLWLAAVYVVFSLTVLRDRPKSFPFGALASGLAVFGGLLVAGPARWIADYNLSLVRHGRTLDLGYVEGLGADAVPSLVRALPGLPAAQRQEASAWLLDRWGSPCDDWRSFNWSRQAAVDAVRSHRSDLVALAAKGATARADSPQSPAR